MKNKSLKRSIFAAAISILVVSISLMTITCSSNEITKDSINKDITETAEYLYSVNPSGTLDNKNINSFILSGINTKTMSYDLVVNIKNELDKNNGKLVYTDTYDNDTVKESASREAKAIIVLGNLGFNPENFYGYNLVETLENYSDWDTLLSNDAYGAADSLEALTKYSKNENAINTLITSILGIYKDSSIGGGFNYWGISVDTNSYFIKALAPYYNSNSNVKNAVDKSIEFIKSMKHSDGYDSSVEYALGAGNADSTAMALVTFSSMNMKDDAKEAFELLQGFKVSGTKGSYSYLNKSNKNAQDSDLEPNDYATGDALTALCYYKIIAPNAKEPTSSNNTSNKPSVKPTAITPALNNTVKPAKPKKVTKVKVVSGKKKLSVKWKKLKSVNGYQIKIGTNKKITKNTKTYKSKTNKNIIKKLGGNKKYYVKVRAYKTYKKADGKTGFVYGKWSAVKSQKTR